MQEIIIENAFENNLKNISLNIPHYNLIAVTGVSGSGKTSLVSDILCAEGQRLFFENFIGGRLSRANLSRPKASKIEGLFPVISIDQNNVVRSPRSTVGTMTEIYDLMRLLFARLSSSDISDVHPYRSLFSFNLPDGYCPACKGLGVQDHIDPELLIGDPEKTIREGAFVLTTPDNYIVYSQVTMDVLNQVCNAEGFSVDIPWKDLSDSQKDVVLNGSDKIKVLFGKHTLESRLKWTGITAKPREEDYYKGILPVMEDILRRDRNPNILRFARTHRCGTCGGKRLNNTALSFKLWGKDISGFSAMTIRQIHGFFLDLIPDDTIRPVLEPVRETILQRSGLLIKLGVGHLSLDRESLSLSGGEAQRIRLSGHVAGGMRNILYILDEPAAGLHPSERRNMLDVLRALVTGGNTVMMVSHDEQSIREADWIIDVGPGAGEEGGRILYNGPVAGFFDKPVPGSRTREIMVDTRKTTEVRVKNPDDKYFVVAEANTNNLKSISPSFLCNALNVITGISGSGKTSLAGFMHEDIISRKSNGAAIFSKVINIDSSPIGRTPKSNPATYTGLSDHVRDLLASLPESKARGYKKGQFSFVVSGGRCEACGGAGVQQIGMHFLGNVEVVCESCDGKRFSGETLEIKHNGLNIHDILELTVDQAHEFFRTIKKISAITEVLSGLGLGYLKLGQPSTTLSGGEAQRVKLATELSRSSSGQTLYILDEPATGLHAADTVILLSALKKLIEKGNTLVCIEHDPWFIGQADRVIDLGPGSADNGGMIVFEGSVGELMQNRESVTAEELRRYFSVPPSVNNVAGKSSAGITVSDPVKLKGVQTNNLKNLTVSFPVNAVTVVTGVSGSGKSSLVYGTLYAESQRRFFEGLPSQLRQSAIKAGVPVLEESSGLIPAVALQKKNLVRNPRSIIATYTGLYDIYRLLFSRLGRDAEGMKAPLSVAFSFNNDEGACPECKGIGYISVCDLSRLVTHPDKPLTGGAMDGSKTGRFYGDPDGQYVATLKAAGEHLGIDFSVPFCTLGEAAVQIAMRGCGEHVFDVSWKYKRGNHEGVHMLKSPWHGFLSLVESEYLRKHNDHRGEIMLDLMRNESCGHCGGYRLKPEMLSYTIDGVHIGELTALSPDELKGWLSHGLNSGKLPDLERKAAITFGEAIKERADALIKAGLGYISTNRIVGTLSGGEYQRLQLAGLVRAPLNGVAYLLDEPSFGLHHDDTVRVTELIGDLRRHNNSVIMVDNSRLMIEEADFIIKLGPGAGDRGGGILFSGKRENAGTDMLFESEAADSIRGSMSEGLKIEKASTNNLKDIDLSIPSGALTVITGVSGSGKTTLLDDVIHRSIISGTPVNCHNFESVAVFTDIIYVGQPVPGKGYTSTVGEKLDISAIIARTFADLDDSRKAGFKAQSFISTSREGRCPECEGTGLNKISMDFFNDVVYACERCGGSGYNDDVMNIILNGLNVFDVQQIPLDDLPRFFSSVAGFRFEKQLSPIVAMTEKTGLGHLSAGRHLNTLSTGELQRLKLVSALSAGKTNGALILLDEPTGGLHRQDVRRLLLLFDELVNNGNTIICVTHEQMVMNAASVVIELGPGGGVNGGEIMSVRS